MKIVRINNCDSYILEISEMDRLALKSGMKFYYEEVIKKHSTSDKTKEYIKKLCNFLQESDDWFKEN